MSLFHGSTVAVKCNRQEDSLTGSVTAIHRDSGQHFKLCADKSKNNLTKKCVGSEYKGNLQYFFI